MVVWINATTLAVIALTLLGQRTDGVGVVVATAETLVAVLGVRASVVREQPARQKTLTPVIPKVMTSGGK